MNDEGEIKRTSVYSLKLKLLVSDTALGSQGWVAYLEADEAVNSFILQHKKYIQRMFPSFNVE